MSKIVKLLSYRIMRYDKSWDKSKEILEYSITLFFETVFVLLSFLGISLMLGKPLTGVTLIITLVLVRNYFGGGHAPSFRVCYCVSNLAFLVAMLFVINGKYISHFVISIVMILSVFFYTYKRTQIKKNLYFSILTVSSTLLFLENIQIGYSLLASCFFTALADLIFIRPEVKK
ncbi:accessory gene regulator B family protein [Enterococcus sp.]|uniref:accessory gene regulator B family protein n=1 Tax=Enterococcus sp. TaxID=35783 RepID=UPI002907569F|nr:accessory gene regulator B family protein [Enterococcus sp.]MDU5337097.1 accessory gene regulator B family protein [Enterococcus sp.]